MEPRWIESTRAEIIPLSNRVWRLLARQQEFEEENVMTLARAITLLTTTGSIALSVAQRDRPFISVY